MCTGGKVNIGKRHWRLNAARWEVRSGMMRDGSAMCLRMRKSATRREKMCCSIAVSRGTPGCRDRRRQCEEGCGGRCSSSVSSCSVLVDVVVYRAMRFDKFSNTLVTGSVLKSGDCWASTWIP